MVIVNFNSDISQQEEGQIQGAGVHSGETLRLLSEGSGGAIVSPLSLRPMFKMPVPSRISSFQLP
jgi:hypothetical protein